MRFIESRDDIVRSAVTILRRPGTPLQFALFPMVHVAEPAFYEQVAARLRGCGLIVAEGLPHAELRQLRRLARVRFDGLVDQVVALDLEALGVPVLWPERQPADEPPGPWDPVLESAGAAVTWLSRIAFPRNLPDVDDTTRPQEPAWPLGRAWDRFTLHDRDKELLLELGRVFRARQQQPLVVAVVYGAYHMAAVAGFLTGRLGYRPAETEWLTVRHGPAAG